LVSGALYCGYLSSDVPSSDASSVCIAPQAWAGTDIPPVYRKMPGAAARITSVPTIRPTDSREFDSDHFPGVYAALLMIVRMVFNQF